MKISGKKIFAVVLGFILIMNFKSVQAQEVDLSISVTQEYVGNFYVGDLDFLQQQSGREVFSVNINNVNVDTTQFGRFDFRIIYVPNKQADAIGGELIHFWTNEFKLTKDAIGKQIKNTQLVSGLMNPSGFIIKEPHSSIFFDDNDMNFENVGPIEDYVKKTGKLPSGKYEFHVNFLQNTGQDGFMIIYNPTILQLSIPGTRAMDNEMFATSTVSNTPLFQWYSDAKIFNLYIYEKLSTDRSVNDVFGHEAYAEINNIPNHYFQYPLEPQVINEPLDNFDNLVTNSIGPVKPLQEGKIYYWFVEAKIPTVSVGIYEKLKSEVFQFKVSALEGIDNENLRILQAVKNILHPTYKETLEELKTYSPTGNIYINGQKVKIETLEKMSFQVLKRKYKINKVIVD